MLQEDREQTFMNPEVQKTSFPQREGVEMLLEDREQTNTHEPRGTENILPTEDRGRNAARAQRTSMNPQVQKTSFPQREGLEMLQEHREHS